MSKQTTQKAATKATKATKATTRKKAANKAAAAPEPTPTASDADELVVFAFRLTRAERDLIHQAAGSAKASRFVRDLAVTAAREQLKS